MPRAVLITKQQRERLLRNGRSHGNGTHPPVVKLFTPDAQCTWLLTELDPGDPRRAFGLADLGMGFPEIGLIWMPDVEKLRGNLGLAVERDSLFQSNGRSLTDWWRRARELGHIPQRMDPLPAESVT